MRLLSLCSVVITLAVAPAAMARGAPAAAGSVPVGKASSAAEASLALATYETRVGRVATALRHLATALATLPANDPRRSGARRLAESLTRRVPRVTVHVEGGGDGARLTQDGAELDDASMEIPLPVDPGDHVYEVARPGCVTAHAAVHLSEGERMEVTLRLEPAAPPTSEPEHASAEPDEVIVVEAVAAAEKEAERLAVPSRPSPLVVSPAPPRGTGEAAARRAATLGLFATGAAAVAAGAVSGAISLDRATYAKRVCGADYGTCSEDAVHAAHLARDAGTASAVLLASGGALAAAGVALALWPSAPAHREGASNERSSSRGARPVGAATVAIAPSGPGFMVSGAF